MTSRRITAVIRAQHGSCCLTNSYRDHGCTIGVHGIDRNGLVTIHGDKHQKQHGITGKLCDRLIFGDGDKAFLCSVELKGGKNVRVSEAIEQIQRGLDLTIDLLDSDPDWDWYPLLAYRDGITRMGTKLLLSRRVSFRGKKKLVDKVKCGFSLLSYLSGHEDAAHS